jgi:hypothetical protein
MIAEEDADLRVASYALILLNLLGLFLAALFDYWHDGAPGAKHSA